MDMVFVLVRLQAVPHVRMFPGKSTGLCQLSTEIAWGCGVSTLTKPLELVDSALSPSWRIDSFVLIACTHLVTQ